MNLREGTLLQGGKYQYRIVKELGQGTFGVTYLATAKVKVVGALGELETMIQVAVKEFFMRDINGRKENTVTCGSQSGIYEDYKRKFAREAQNLCRLHHPHIVRVLEQFEANNTYYYVMEYCEGGSLDALISSRGRIDEKNCIGYLRQIGEALAYMHGQKMLHLDLKPGNIMLRNDTDAVLIDFGLAKQYNAEGEAETSIKVGLGTPGYAPIEQADWKGKGFPVTMDVYAMGATLYKMLVGVRPPDASHIVNNPNSLVDELTQQGVSRQLAVVISKAMAPIVKDRYPNVEQMLAALDGDNTMMEAKRNAPKEEATSLVIDEEKGDVHAIEQAKQEAMNALRIIERDFEAACAKIERMIAIKGGGVDEFDRLNKIGVLPNPLRHEIYRWNERYGKISPDLAARWRDLERRWMDKEHVIDKNKRSARERLENVSMVPTGNCNGHDYVDLGLSVMWATYDVGAKSLQNLGWHCAWGEHYAKSEYTLDNYGWKGAYRTGLLKLKKKWKCMEIGSNISGDRFHDAAAFMWRAGWRMPTREEWQELIEKCMWFEKKDGGHEGWVVIGPNGNGIFLPISKEDRCYWSANSAEETNNAYVCGVFNSNVKRFCIYNAERFSGHRVRPVINKQSVIREEKASNPTPPTNSINGHEYVDLGLSVKWATCNVGASSPSDYGSYYAWGETSTKNDYSRNTYKYYENGNYVNIGQSISGTQYDVARAHWGGTWRLPTKAEFQELIDKCSWTWTSQNGVNGYKVTGKNGKSIFLPAAGWRNGTLLGNAGGTGNYWIGTNHKEYAYGFGFGKRLVGLNCLHDGHSVRPVSE